MGMLATAITSVVGGRGGPRRAGHAPVGAGHAAADLRTGPASRGVSSGSAAPWLLELFGSQYRAGSATTVLQL
jgi:hypothetical protein